MNFVEKVIYYYEYLFYKQEVCFICGRLFTLYDNDEDLIPACSKSCIMEGLNNIKKREQRQQFKLLYGKNWKSEYKKYLKF